ncbi:MAG: 4a-hydroxytetrahydrobiopterin dehydratase [Herpetosiphon sp.]|nr:4a-hydroxytetrahydrobiopterin dehydratase [Herpetosiphon sp.]
MPVLSESELNERLEAMPDWNVVKGEITRTYKLASFPFAIEFVRQIGDLAEAAGHHPDIDIRYDNVKIALSTHDEKGITEKDFNLAKQIDALLD